MLIDYLCCWAMQRTEITMADDTHVLNWDFAFPEYFVWNLFYATQFPFLLGMQPINTLVADDSVMQGAKSSAAMVLN